MAKEMRRSSMENKPPSLPMSANAARTYFRTRLRISLVHLMYSKVDDFSSRAPAPNCTQTQ